MSRVGPSRDSDTHIESSAVTTTMGIAALGSVEAEMITLDTMCARLMAASPVCQDGLENTATSPSVCQAVLSRMVIATNPGNAFADQAGKVACVISVSPIMDVDMVPVLSLGSVPVMKAGVVSSVIKT